ncbi:flagellar basal body P-ring formation chaperone FlgA [Oceanicola sp. S124]|uniref:flagellar basal body P-ring formation chaperone FlgA n=1 Tax=Oceanicola sp. S124 TaxID=1042378 RepID=UPI0002558D63|nr:flagellar basal body P-ring formation chaperone FlgA [Oceanicola sp. S124]
MRALAILLLIWPAMLPAETVVATRNLRAQTVLSERDFALRDIQVAGALSSVEGLAGMETRGAIYIGRPIRPGDVGPPAVVERNGIVSLIYDSGGLLITAEGRALGRGGVGDRLRVMNLSSRMTISGIIQSDGSVKVQ